MKQKLLLTLLGFFITILSNAQVKISEVYFDSNFDEANGNSYHHYGEFIELYNRSNQSIDISNWVLNDNFGGISLPQGTIIEPQGFIVITNGTTTGTYANVFPTLFPEAQGKQAKTIYQQNIEFNNKSDYIILKDNTGKVIDQLYYSKTDVCKGLGTNSSGYCYKTTIDNAYGGVYNSAINKNFTFSIQRQNFDNNSLLVAAKATPFSLITADNYAGGSGSSGSGGSTTTAPAFTDDNYIYSRTYLTPVTTENASAQQIQAIQYFDGLGRPKQSIAIKATPKGNDLVTPIVYDGFGRQTRDYLPVPQSSTSNGALYTQNSGLVAYPVTDATNFYNSEKIYSEKNLENSPLDRVMQQYQVGNDWSAKPINFGYDANQVTDYIIDFGTETTWTNNATTSNLFPKNQGYYPANTLYKNTVTDEDGNVSIEFKNGQGQTLLVRKMLETTPVDTYYVYNEYDQLAFVIPPKATEEIILYNGIVVGDLIDNTILDNLCYQYRYDAQNRLVEKKLPGKGWEYMVYDKQDRLVATQDANMRVNNQWLFTKYDKFGRVAYTGIVTGSSRTAEQTSADAAQSNYVERKTSIAFTQNGLDVYYGNPTNITSYPTTIATLLSVNYYDEYPTGISYQPTTIESQIVIGTSGNVNLKGLPVASFVKNIEDNGWTKTYTYYDQKARPIGTHSDNYLGGYTRTATKLKFSGKPEYTLTYHKKADRSDITIIKETFEYDNQERLTKHWHQVNSTGNNELLAENIYNEIGQLQSKKVGGNSSTPLQNVDYNYNIRGWMTQINNPANLGADLFGYKIKYNQVDGLQIPNVDYQNDKVLPKYNGNIAEIDWVTGTEYNPIKKRFGYVYDGLNRLIAGYYQPENNASGQEYFERLQYDVNGNITELKRSGNIIQGYSIANLIDNLGYSYTGNQLTKVVDTSGKSDGYPSLVTHNTILYDANGNMTQHLDKKISSVSYNFLNLANKILPASGSQFTGNTDYIYRADGQKIRKKYYLANKFEVIDKTTDYLDGFQYENNVLQFVPTAEGYYDFNLKDYIYNFTDHLGNVRLSYRAADGGGFEILEENNYYPFGLKFVNENLGTKATPSYNYKYNGKELQETGMTAMDFRHYMNDIGRFAGIDRLSELAPGISPYRFAYNNPISYSDPSGLFETSFGAWWHRLWSANGGSKIQQDANGEFFYKPVVSRGKNNEGVYTIKFGDKEYGNTNSTQLGGLIQNANVDANGNTPLDNYRQWQNNPGYNTGETWGDRTVRLMGAFSYEARRDFASGGMNMYGGYGRIAKTLEATERASQGLTDLELITKSAQKAESAIGGTGRFAGTAKHTYAIKLLERYQSIYGDRGLQFNQYFNQATGRGFLDIVSHNTQTIYDFKFGSAVMSNPQYLKYSTSFPGYSIKIIRP